MKQLEKEEGLYLHNILGVIAESAGKNTTVICKSYGYQKDNTHVVASKSTSYSSFGECVDYYHCGQLIFSSYRNPEVSGFNQLEIHPGPQYMEKMIALAKKIVLEKLLGT